ncbi:MAG: hypothetical protein IT381_18715 [Deltaproteobacteria bacterium]|nr:hypothetical protein [Deltaproteobacteria bacterium]
MKRAWLVFFVVLCSARSAHANWFDLFGVGGRGAAMGSAMTAAADDWTATYYNPALLTLAPTPTFGFGYALMAPKLDMALINTSPAYEPRQTQFQSGINAGFSMPMPGRLGERLHMGLVAFIPIGPLVRVRMIDSSMPHFFAYDYAPGTFVISTALGLEITEWLRVGFGVHILASLVGGADMSLDIANGRFPLKNMDAALFITPSPTAGIAVTPVAGLSLAVSYRGQISVDVNIPAKAHIEGLAADLDLNISGTTQWKPHQINFGAAYMIPKFPLLLAVDCTYALWSLAPDPTLQVALALTGDDIARLGLLGVLDAPTPGNERKLPPGYFSNTFSFRAGAEYRAIDWFAIRAGYNLRPSHVPVQTSGTNLLDNDTHTLSLGLGFRFKDATKFFTGYFSIDTTAQLGLLPQRQHIKDTADDPVGDLSAGGSLFNFSVMLSYLFGP